MPIYEYICASCKHEFEELSRSVREGKTTRCPACGSRAAKRKLSVFAAREGTSASGGPAVDGGCVAHGEGRTPVASQSQQNDVALSKLGRRNVGH